MIGHRDFGEEEDAPATHVGAAGRNVIAAIGIDRYRRWPALRNAVSDAQGALRVFRSLGFEDVAPPLLNDAATGDAIDALVTDDLATLSRNDRLIVFFAGHGGTRAQDLGGTTVTTGYLIPVDGDESPHHAASWIEVDGFPRRISKLPPLHILVVLDACNSGIALSRMVHWGRGSGRLPDSPFAALHTRRSRVVITSALDDERALDNGPLPGHSLFTGCLIEALTGGVPGVELADGCRVASGSDLGHYIRQRVQTYPGAPGWRQTPDFGVFDYDQRGEMPIPLDLGGGAVGQGIALPKLLAAGSAPTILAVTPEELFASEPAFTAGRRALDKERPSSPRLLLPPAAAEPAPTLLSPEVAELAAPVIISHVHRRVIAGLACVALALLAVLVARGVRDDTGPATVAAMDPDGSKAKLATSPAGTSPASAGGPGTTSAGAATAGASGAATAPRPPAAPAVEATPGSTATLPSRAQPPLAVGGPAVGRAVAGRVETPAPGGASEVGARPRHGSDPAAVDPAPRVTQAASATGSVRKAAPRPPAAPPAATCFVDAKSTPSHADVLRDAQRLGTTPTRLALPCGAEVSLTFQLERYTSTHKVVVPTTGGAPVSTRLTRATYTVLVDSSPIGASILVASKTVGITPAMVKLPAGKTSTVIIAMDGYASASREVTEAVTKSVHTTLEKLPPKVP